MTHPIDLATITIGDLTAADLPKIAWSGSESHLKAVSKLLGRLPSAG
jgi:hypothetical protein